MMTQDLEVDQTATVVHINARNLAISQAAAPTTGFPVSGDDPHHLAVIEAGRHYRPDVWAWARTP